MADTQEAKTQEAVVSKQPTMSSNPAPQLTIADLQALLNIIDAASSRGAFRANEMASIGLVYNKLQAFLARVAPPEAEKKEGTMAPTTTPTQQAPTPITPITPKSVGKI